MSDQTDDARGTQISTLTASGPDGTIPIDESTWRERPLLDIYTLYGAQISNYTAKVRSYLIFKGIPFQEVTASNAVYDNFLVPRIGFRMMPVLRTPEGDLLQDSTDIIDHLEARFPAIAVYPSTPVLGLANLLIAAYAQDWVRIIAMYYRWSFPETNYEYLKGEFGRMYEPMAPPDEQLVIGDKSCGWTRDRLPSMGVSAETAPEFECWTENLLRWLDAHFIEHNYLFGLRPSTADFTFMGPLYAHMYRDLYSSALMRRICPNVVRWVERMNSRPKGPGAYFAIDEVPETLMPVIRHLFAEYIPVAYDTIDQVADWIDANPGRSIPRFLGTQDFRIGKAVGKRSVWTCFQYAFQGPLFHYQNASEMAKRAMDGFLAHVGNNISLDKVVRHPIQHHNYRLVAGIPGVYKLYGTPTSYYTAKVRSYLNFKRIPYEEILTTAEVYENVVMKRTGVWMIPVLISPDGLALQDSTEMIDFLEVRFPQAPVYPKTPKQKLATLILELFGDEWLIMTAIHYRWNKEENRAFAIKEFGRQAKPSCLPQEQWEAGLEKARIFSGWVGDFGIDDTTGPAVEEAYEELLVAFDRHLQDHKYFFGSRPSLADFSFFGGLYAALNRDPLSGRLMAQLAPRVCQWVERMRHRQPQAEGSFVGGDEVPDTLLPILKAAFSDQFPVLRDTVPAVAAWVRDHPSETLPKTIGTHDFMLRGRRGHRRIFPYPQWMFQRVLDFYAALAPQQRADVAEWAAGLGGLEFLDMTIECRVKRENFKLAADQ